jgi:hypothetical protein
MLKKKLTTRGGFTMVELMLVIGLITIIFVSIGIVLVDTLNGWHKMYECVYSDVVTNGYVATKTFDRVIRQASSERFLLDGAGSWIEVYNYADSNSAAVDRYTYFYEDDGQLKIEYGRLSPRETISIHTICRNVSNCLFKGVGKSAQMILTLDDGSRTATVVSSSVMQNQ